MQQFSYDAHDKMQIGTAGSEVPGYDKNGSETSVSIYGGVYRDTYDDEDRLISVAVPGGPTDTFVYNGLGLRVGKTDSTGTYSYVCDGTTPGSPVLSDGHALYTPGLSENRGGVAAYYANDRLGNLWTLDGSSKNPLTYADFNGFGQTTAGSLGGTPFGFGGGNGCQTEVDTGLVLMGHRYYDTRIGRFITQDPAGSGDNWYAYAGNDPVDETDPLGLTPTVGEDGFADPNGYNEVPGSAWDDGQGHSGAKYLISGSSTDPVSSSGGMLGAVGGFVDNWVTFGMVSHAGQVAGEYDSGHASRGAAIGAGALAVGAIALTAVTRGEDSEGVVEARAESKIGGWITKDVFSTLEQKVGKADMRKFVAALQKGVVGPNGESGIKRLARPVGNYTHELKIGRSGNRILGNLGEWRGEAKYIFDFLTGHLDK